MSSHFCKKPLSSKVSFATKALTKTDEDGFATFDIRLFLFGLGAFFHLWQEKRKLVVKACSGKIRYEQEFICLCHLFGFTRAKKATDQADFIIMV